MVSLGKEELMGPEEPGRSNRLHNFKMPWLKWGSRKVMRCMKVDNSNGQVPAMANGHRRSSERSLIGRNRDSELERRGSSDRRREIFKFSSSLSPPPGKDNLGFGRKLKQPEDGIEAMRERLMVDFQTAADEIKDAILRKGLEEQEQQQQPVPTNVSAAKEPLKPWNLRTRRAACKAPPTDKISVGAGNGGCGGGILKRNPSPSRNETTKSPWLLRGSTFVATDGAAAAASSGEKRERAKFSVSLSRKEIEDDFMAMVGHKLPRRPKKRPKTVQKQLDMLFPGLWLTEVNADLYKVPDLPETGKS